MQSWGTRDGCPVIVLFADFQLFVRHAQLFYQRGAEGGNLVCGYAGVKEDVLGLFLKGGAFGVVLDVGHTFVEVDPGL